MAERILATLGYEGATIEQVLAVLKASGVRLVADVRELPLSRKKGFSKTALQASVEKAGMIYMHFRALGDPRDGRLAARAGDTDRFRRIYTRHLNRTAGQVSLQALGASAATSTTCLLCYERLPANCHRTIVARRLAARRGFKIEHLFV